MAVPANLRGAAGMTPELEAAAKAAGADLNDPGPDPEEGNTPVEAPDDGANRPETGGGTEQEDELPDSYFGRDIKGFREQFGDEAARQFYNELQEANRGVNSQMQRLATERKQAEEARRQAELQRRAETLATDPDEDWASKSDEELLAALGVDTAILEYEEVGKPVAQIARIAATLRDQLESVRSEVRQQTGEAQFFGALDKLQERYGKLPDEYDRGTIEDFAVQRQIFDPEAIYMTIMGPVWAVNPPTTQAKPAASGDDGRNLRDVKRGISSPRRQAPAGGAVQAEKPKSLADFFKQAKTDQNVSGDPFAWEE